MASIVITIETDGTAFHAKNPSLDYIARGTEIARILRAIAVQCEYGEKCDPPRDIYDKVVGKVEVTE